MNQFDDIDRDQPLSSLSPDEVLSKLDLMHPGLEDVKAAADAGETRVAFDHLSSTNYPLNRRRHFIFTK